MKRDAPDPSWPAAAQALAALAGWFEANRRDLPWRTGDLDRPHPDPYLVLVSELMLQQTQVAAVVPFFLRWLRDFPDAAALAAADSEAVHAAWAGLGYYRRARMLQAAARAIVVGGWPDSVEGLRRLPGLGPYSAAAVAAIAFQQPEPALDGNALRVAARLLALEDPRACAGAIRGWLVPALVRHGPSRMTQAIMELGATVCLPRSPRCPACPLAGDCRARKLDVVERCPAPRPRTAQKQVDLWLVAATDGRAWLLERPAPRGLLAGLWRWPALPAPGAPATTAAPGATAIALPGWDQVYTHRIERVTPWLLRVDARFGAGPDREWLPSAQVAALAMGRRDQRLRSLVLDADRPGGDPRAAAALLAALAG